MSVEPFLAEIALFAGNFAPRGWAFCQGQLISIAQNTALFSLLGTTYGGDGRVTFALPNLQASVAVGAGVGPGLTPRVLGEAGGVAQVTLTQAQMPVHAHPASTAQATTNRPVGNVPAVGGRYANAAPPITTAPHENRPPSLALNYIIATQGIFPSRP